MSYILDALRKSESERQQGRIPDLGQQVQLIHRPRRRGIPAGVWVAFALCLNAVIVGAIFWPDLSGFGGGSADNGVRRPGNIETPESTARSDADPANQPTASSQAGDTSFEAPGSVVGTNGKAADLSPEAAGGDVIQGQDRPTVIVPSANRAAEPSARAVVSGVDPVSSERVPHLVELPMSFQRRVPTLIFNSHVYASDPASRRVIINDHYLRVGDTFSGIRVVRITEDGVVLSMAGQRFRVGVVRDWISPR